jgi:hypothetical protein
MKVFVVIALFRGEIDFLRAFAEREKANQEYQRLCKEYNFDPKAKYHERYYEEEIQLYEVILE